MGWAQKLWRHLADPGDATPIEHDVYLKRFQLGGGRLPGHIRTVYLDEAQDSNPVTLAILEEYQRTRVVALLLRAFVRRVIDEVDACWFTVTPDNAAARALHATLGAHEVLTHLDYYGPGDRRIASVIDAERFGRLRTRYERLGLVEPSTRRLEAVP